MMKFLFYLVPLQLQRNPLKRFLYRLDQGRVSLCSVKPEKNTNIAENNHFEDPKACWLRHSGTYDVTLISSSLQLNNTVL